VKNKSLEPETYPHPDGAVYMCGWADEEAQPPERADIVEPSRDEAIDTVKQLLHKVVPRDARFGGITSSGVFFAM
jgi:hypothetical protein